MINNTRDVYKSSIFSDSYLIFHILSSRRRRAARARRRVRRTASPLQSMTTITPDLLQRLTDRGEGIWRD